MSATLYRFIIPEDGWVILLARSPSFVRISSPCEFLSSLPQQKSFILSNGGGKSSNTVFASNGSELEHRYPLGLFMASATFSEAAPLATAPSTSTLSLSGSTSCPMRAISPLTVTAPSRIFSSAARREHMPHWEMYFCILINNAGRPSPPIF